MLLQYSWTAWLSNVTVSRGSDSLSSWLRQQWRRSPGPGRPGQPEHCHCQCGTVTPTRSPSRLAKRPRQPLPVLCRAVPRRVGDSEPTKARKLEDLFSDRPLARRRAGGPASRLGSQRKMNLRYPYIPISKLQTSISTFWKLTSMSGLNFDIEVLYLRYRRFKFWEISISKFCGFYSDIEAVLNRRNFHIDVSTLIS
jgi:hypothetical protein